MAEPRRTGPRVRSIAAHRGFADALVAGLVPRYREDGFGLARLTLLVPSSRAARTLSEAFIRHAGENGMGGLLMPRMIAVGDLDLDEKLGPALDPLGATDIPPACDPVRRWLTLDRLIAEERAAEGLDALPGRARLNLAREMARTIDRLLVEEKTVADLLGDAVLDSVAELAEHWKRAIRLFARVAARWQAELAQRGEVDAATRRNLLFDHAARRWKEVPPPHPVIAAGVTSAAPALARLLRVVAELPEGAVVLPDCDLAMDDAAWDELGLAGAAAEPGGPVFGAADAVTHPQYHLKLLLNRMGVNRAEVQPWHRRGMTAAEPARSRAISSLFLPPQASRAWVGLDADRRRLDGVRLMTCAAIEEEAQAIALLVRQALEQPAKRIAVVAADRGLARRVVQHLERWNIAADDSAGRPLALTPAGRLFGLLAEIAAKGPDPASLVAAFGHPLVRAWDDGARREWLTGLRVFDRALRGPSPAPGLEPLREIAGKAKIGAWWDEAEALIAPLADWPQDIPLAEALARLSAAAEAFARTAIWEREDGRALGQMVEELRGMAASLGTMIETADLAGVLRDQMEAVAVRPGYGGHPRVAIYGLLEARMARADLVICAGLNEGSWPQAPGADALLAPAILRAMGVPGAEFRIGLAAHDLAGAMGAPQVVLSRSLRDAEGPTLPSRFLLRVEALLGDDLEREHLEFTVPALLPHLDRQRPPADKYPRPAPEPSAALRDVPIRVTALDRLLGDPYQFYAQAILGLRQLDPLAADPFSDPALRGTLVHDILDTWHKAKATEPGLALAPFAAAHFEKKRVHPLFRALWQPRLISAMERFERMIADDAAEQGREVLATEIDGEMTFDGVRIIGRADRIDRLADGSLAIVDYKTGAPPSKTQVTAGYALQLGLLGLIAQEGRFSNKKTGQVVTGEATRFEYWSLGKARKEEGFGFRETPMRIDKARTGIEPGDYLPFHADKLALAISRFIRGTDPFTARENPDYKGYNEYDQLMRLEEWLVRMSGPDSSTGGGAA
ncbi:double-strand break repair protein AddB [Porphyrobacter sp. CACIAM 03H1]|uniref:double-strand break repair protein AddB n=1 Tax=Porphyrobacter sp. CACIAM 03H1 TaxID=2003315 RepID=UPI000B5A65AA|nr:double-strand break repair protein AddB [Porphyrobacter sp. CACIAM 03H1]ASJ91132.1 double-strand break repair protein AddB [Porphyrobacter sp. CACIAM 03H1]